MACPFAFSALAGLIFLAWVRSQQPKVIYRTPMLKMNCQRWLENPNSLSQLVQTVPDHQSHRCRGFGCPAPDPTGRATRKQYAAKYAVRCHLLYSDFHFPPCYTLLSFWEK